LRGRYCLALANDLAFPVGLTGCNANQGVNRSSQTDPGVVAGPNFPNYNPSNPISYAQTSGFYPGGGGGR
jgi:hypothetical protein